MLGLNLVAIIMLGLLVREAQTGHIAPKDAFYCMVLLGLCHSIVEDTLFVLTLGPSLTGILVARLIFALLIVALLVRLTPLLPESFQRRDKFTNR